MCNLRTPLPTVPRDIERSTMSTKQGVTKHLQETQLFPMNRMGKVTGNKPKATKCKLDTGASVHIMPLSICQYINPSEFDEQGKPIDGHGQYKTILKDYNGNPIQQYGIKVILGTWNHQ